MIAALLLLLDEPTPVIGLSISDSLDPGGFVAPVAGDFVVVVVGDGIVFLATKVEVHIVELIL
jgi:hypothetical protein